MALNFVDKIDKAANSISSIEHMLGKGLIQPMNGLNSGARKIMAATHREHALDILTPEKAILETGYEIRYGDYSSSITKTDAEYRVIAKISKFSFAPNHHYWLIFENLKEKKLDVQLRISYEYITESYGYLYNNEYMDTLNVGDIVHEDTILQKSTGFDEYNNRRDGRNFNIAYMALDDNMEDSIVLSDAAAATLTAPLIKPVQIMINDNDIPLNIYGNDKIYKVIPDIGEDVKDANLIALRKEKKDESYYAQSVDRLRQIEMSDEKRQVTGKVIDVDIYCNNPEILDNHYYGQLKMYYNELHRYSTEIVQAVLPYVSQGYKLSYDLEKLFANAKRVMNNDQYIDKKTFSNIILNITVLEELPMKAGDKAANRYGGKGVLSSIWPQKFMPRYKDINGEYHYVDLIFNSSTMVNRENVAQCFELSLTHIGEQIIDKIKHDRMNVYDAYDLIHQYVSFCSQEQADSMDEMKANMTEEELQFYIESIVEDGDIHISMKPYSDLMTIDKLREMYKAFPFVKKNDTEIALQGSDGTVRYMKTRQPMVVGKEYIYRLKQFAEEKFSATSLSATNIRNENTKSKAKKDFRELYPNTPIRFGNMETNNFCHLGADVVISNMMIHSLSPQGRRLVEQMYTDDPFHIDIKLTSDASNRSAEIANTYLKTVGRRLVFIKQPKHIHIVSRSPFWFTKDPYKHPFTNWPKEIPKSQYNYENYLKEQQRLAKLRKTARSPFKFAGVDRKRREQNKRK